MTADDRRDGLADGPAGDLTALEVRLLADALAAAGKVAARLAWSRRRVAGLMPLAAEAVTGLSDEDEERLDALLLRFNSLTAMIQDHVVRALLLVEEEEIKDRSRKDQRLLVEKLGALRPHLGFATLAELRNRVAHHDPDDPGRQAAIRNEVFARTDDLLEAHDGILAYADRKIFAGTLGLKPAGPAGTGGEGSAPPHPP